MTSLRFRLFLLPLLLWLAVIFTMSTRAGSDQHTISALEYLLRLIPGAMRHISPEQIGAIDFAVRKSAHFTEYFILGALFSRWYRTCSARVRRSVPTLSWLSATLYAASDEFHQIFVAGRTPKLTDVAIDSAGALAAVLIYAMIVRRRRDAEKELVLTGPAKEAA